jgi:hypothetical protein
MPELTGEVSRVQSMRAAMDVVLAPVAAPDEATGDDDAEVEGRLRALGYL